VLSGTLGFLALVLYLSAAQRLFHLAPVHGLDLVMAAAAGTGSILWYELLKVLRRDPRPVRATSPGGRS
jgi:hypothetical protein